MMFNNGWIEECQQLKKDDIDLKKIKEIGYSDINAYLEGLKSLEEVKSIIKQRTRNYAKRQMTWFKHKMNCQFFDLEAVNVNTIDENINAFLKK